MKQQGKTEPQRKKKKNLEKALVMVVEHRLGWSLGWGGA